MVSLMRGMATDVDTLTWDILHQCLHCRELWKREASSETASDGASSARQLEETGCTLPENRAAELGLHESHGGQLTRRTIGTSNMHSYHDATADMCWILDWRHGSSSKAVSDVMT